MGDTALLAFAEDHVDPPGHFVDVADEFALESAVAKVDFIHPLLHLADDRVVVLVGGREVFGGPGDEGVVELNLVGVEPDLRLAVLLSRPIQQGCDGASRLRDAWLPRLVHRSKVRRSGWTPGRNVRGSPYVFFCRHRECRSEDALRGPDRRVTARSLDRAVERRSALEAFEFEFFRRHLMGSVLDSMRPVFGPPRTRWPRSAG